MMNSILKTGAATLLALAIIGAPAQLLAQTTNALPPAKKSSTAKKTDAKTDKQTAAHPFHGKLAGVDKVAKSIQIGKTTYYVTSETKITKGTERATLNDGVIGEEASGYVKPGDGGKMVATSLRFGPKPQAAGTEKTKNK